MSSPEGEDRVHDWFQYVMDTMAYKLHFPVNKLAEYCGVTEMLEDAGYHIPVYGDDEMSHYMSDPHKISAYTAAASDPEAQAQFDDALKENETIYDNIHKEEQILSNMGEAASRGEYVNPETGAVYTEEEYGKLSDEEKEGIRNTGGMSDTDKGRFLGEKATEIAHMKTEAFESIANEHGLDMNNPEDKSRVIELYNDAMAQAEYKANSPEYTQKMQEEFMESNDEIMHETYGRLVEFKHALMLPESEREEFLNKSPQEQKIEALSVGKSDEEKEAIKNLFNDDALRRECSEMSSVEAAAHREDIMNQRQELEDSALREVVAEYNKGSFGIDAHTIESNYCLGDENTKSLSEVWDEMDPEERRQLREGFVLNDENFNQKYGTGYDAGVGENTESCAVKEGEDNRHKRFDQIVATAGQDYTKGDDQMSNDGINISM